MPLRLIKTLALITFLLQIFLSFQGVNYFTKMYNPLVLLGSYLFLLGLYYHSIETTELLFEKISFKKKIFVGALGIVVFLSCFPWFHQSFLRVSNPVEISDVIPQLVIQFERFIAGENPYQIVNLPHSQPFPVYMPFQWMPVGISKLFSIDVRWSGLLLMLLSVFYFSAYSIKNNKATLNNAALLLLPLLPFLAYLHWGENDLLVSIETIIAAYYLFLGIALVHRNKMAITLGIVLCLLSRYTFVFWLPFFFYVYYTENGRIASFKLLSILLLSLLCFYVFPFLMKHPTIFIEGLKYHNNAAEGEWQNGGWSFYSGDYLAPFFEQFFKGNIHEKVTKVRIVQASVMLILCFGGILFYRKKKNDFSSYDFSLGLLYLTIICFYVFSPLTYRYYLITPMMLSAVLCLRIFKGVPKKMG